MGRFPELAGNEIIVVEFIFIWQIESILGFGLFPRAFFGGAGSRFFGAAKAWFPDANLGVAEWAGILQILSWHWQR